MKELGFGKLEKKKLGFQGFEERQRERERDKENEKETFFYEIGFVGRWYCVFILYCYGRVYTTTMPLLYVILFFVVLQSN